MKLLWGTPILAFVLLCGCNQAAGPGGRPAMVSMRDGSRIRGMVVSSSSSEMELAGEDKITRKIPMAQVRSVEYDDAPPAGAATNAPPPPGFNEPPSGDLSHENHYHPTESAVTTTTHVVPAGAEVSVRCEETIDSARAEDGQTFAAEVTRNITDEQGRIVIPRGANAQIVVRSAARGGRIRGSSDLVLDLASVSIEGRRYRLNTAGIEKRGRSGVGANRRTAEYTGGGAAIGAIIGAIAGGGRGAAIGAGSGAGAGALGQMVTKGGSVRVPVESILTFRLETPLRVTRSE